MKIDIKVIGAEAVIKALANKAKEAKKVLNRELSRAALIVEADAKKEVPVDTGRLRASITHQIVDDLFLGTYAKVGTNVEYAPHVEFGTKRTKARPYLYPALAKNFGKIQKMLTNSVKRVFS